MVLAQRHVHQERQEQHGPGEWRRNLPDCVLFSRETRSSPVSQREADFQRHTHSTDSSTRTGGRDTKVGRVSHTATKCFQHNTKRAEIMQMQRPSWQTSETRVGLYVARLPSSCSLRSRGHRGRMAAPEDVEERAGRRFHSAHSARACARPDFSAKTETTPRHGLDERGNGRPISFLVQTNKRHLVRRKHIAPLLVAPLKLVTSCPKKTTK